MSLNFKQICRTYLIIFSFPILSTSTWMPHPTVNAMKSLKSFQTSSYFISPSCFSLCVLLRAPKVNLTSKWKSFLGLKMSWAWFNGLKRCLLLSHTTWVWPQDPQVGRRKLTPISCPLIFKWVLWHMHIGTHVHAWYTNTWTNKKTIHSKNP